MELKWNNIETIDDVQGHRWIIIRCKSPITYGVYQKINSRKLIRGRENIDIEELKHHEEIQPVQWSYIEENKDDT